MYNNFKITGLVSKLFILICLLYVLFSFNNIVVVHADGIGDNENAKKLWQYLVGEKGTTELWAATTIGNAYAEHSLKTSTKLENGYWGAFQFKGKDSYNSFKSFISTKGYAEEDIVGQYEYFIQEYRGSSCKAICGVNINEIEKNTTYIVDAKSAAAYFAAGMEGCVCWSGITKGVGKIQDRHHNESRDTSFDFTQSGSKYGTIQLQNLEGRITNTQTAYQAFTGSVAPGSGGGNNTGENSANTSQDGSENTELTIVPLAGGAYTEAELSNMIVLAEKELSMSDSSTLSTNQTYTLNNWKDTISSNLEETILVTWARRIVTIIGILFTLWMIFLYLAYWFDRVNIFFEFSMLEALSFGRLRVSPEEDKCTWQFSELIKSKKSNTMTVNNRAMLEIVIIGCIFGGLVISGVLFKIIRFIVLGILKFFNII